jgi:hypothetical protein
MRRGIRNPGRLTAVLLAFVVTALVILLPGVSRSGAAGEASPRLVKNMTSKVSVDWDPTRPNEEFFKHADYVISRAEELGLLMGLVTAKSSHVNAHPEKGFNEAGIAAAYPGDQGLERDPRVLFVENFETGDLRAIGARWGDVRGPENMELSDDVASASWGKRSLHIVGGMRQPKTVESAVRPEFRSGGHLYMHFRGVEQIHARFSVKFPPRTGYLHHSTTIIADRDPTPWPKGYAGKRPAGDQLISTEIAPWSDWGRVPPPGAWGFYSYWHEMKPDGRDDYWGNLFGTRQEPIQPDRWYCIEAMVKANTTPNAADGEQAFWVDGKLGGYFKGIRWRSSDLLKFNTFWLHYLVSENTAEHNNDPDPKNRRYEIWFDDVVLATDYIGPLQGKPTRAR